MAEELARRIESVVSSGSEILDLSGQGLTDEIILQFQASAYYEPPAYQHKLQVIELNLSHNEIAFLTSIFPILAYCELWKIQKINLSHNLIISKSKKTANNQKETTASEIASDDNLALLNLDLPKMRLSFVDLSHNRIAEMEDLIGIAELFLSNIKNLSEIRFHYNLIATAQTEAYRTEIVAIQKELKRRKGVEEIGLSPEFLTISDNNNNNSVPVSTLRYENLSDSVPLVGSQYDKDDDLDDDIHPFRQFERWIMRGILWSWSFLPRAENNLSSRRLCDIPSSYPVDMQNLSRVLFVTQFSQGFKFGINAVWPGILASLMILDFFYKCDQPETCYGNVPDQVLIGETKSLPEVFISWLGLFLAIPIMLGTFRWLSRFHWRHSPQNWTSNITHFNLAHLSWSALWDVNAPRANLMNAIASVPSASKGGLIELRALDSLASIVDSFFKHSPNTDIEEDFSGIKQAKQETLNILKGLSSHFARGGRLFPTTLNIRYIYANYLLWTLGRARHVAVDVVFGSIELARRGVVYYTAYRFLVRALVQKFKDAENYQKDKDKCDSQHKKWYFIREKAKDGCQSCDWPEVYFGDRETEQSCVNGLLLQSQSAETIINSFSELQTPNVNYVDMSRQEWTSWAQEQWDNFLDQLLKLVSLDTLNLSRQTANTYWDNEAKILSLADLFENMNITNFDIHNQNLGPDLIGILFPVLARNGVVNANLAGNNANNSVAVLIAQNLLGSDIRSINLAQNNFDDYLVTIIAENLGNVASINFSNNYVTGIGFNAIGKNLLASQLIHIDWSGNDLSDGDWIAWGRAQQQSKLQSVNFANCQLNDPIIQGYAPYLVGSALEELNISNNPITINGMSALFDYLGDTNISSLNIAYLPISTDDTLALINSLSKLVKLKKLNISGIRLSPEAKQALKDLLTKTKIEELIADDCGLGDEGVQLIADVLGNNATSLQIFSAIDNGITDNGAASLFDSLPYCDVAKLYLSNNAIVGPALANLANVLENSKLTDAVLDSNGITGDYFISFVERIGKNLLKVISFANNPLGPETGMAFAEQLITQVSKFNTLSEKYVSCNEKHAVNHAQPNTNLEVFNLGNTLQDTGSIRAICRVLASANISSDHWNLTNNANVNANEVNDINCQMSSAASLKPWPKILVEKADAFTQNNPLFLNLVPLMQAFILFYVFYKVIEPGLMSVGFFAQPKTQSDGAQVVRNVAQEMKY